jgi:hypothetical protein
MKELSSVLSVKIFNRYMFDAALGITALTDDLTKSKIYINILEFNITLA